MTRIPTLLLAAGASMFANDAGVFAQGRINTDIAAAQKEALATGRPILAIAGKKT